VIDVEYDSCGRMKYHPFFHDKQGTKWTEEDIEYLCKYADIDNLETLGMALGRTKATVAEKLHKIRKAGKYDYYRTLNKYWG
jgi:hypothetical protein